jgi:sec-independent protein translocase protein TatA
MYQLTPLFPGLPGGIEIFVVLLVVVLLFGANKLPKLARSSGQALGEFKKGREQVEDEPASMQDADADADADSVVGAGTEGETVADASADRPDPEATPN